MSRLAAELPRGGVILFIGVSSQTVDWANGRLVLASSALSGGRSRQVKPRRPRRAQPCPAETVSSIPLIGVHREGAIGRAGMDAPPLRGAGGAERGEEGQEMLLARVVARRVGGAPAIVDEIVGAPLDDRRLQPIGERPDPGHGG